MYLPIFAFSPSEPWFIVVMIIVFFGVLAGLTFLIHRLLNKQKIKKGNPQTPEEIASEELKQVLKPYEPEDSVRTEEDETDTEE